PGGVPPLDDPRYAQRRGAQPRAGRGDRRSRCRGMRALLSRVSVRSVGWQVAGRSDRRCPHRHARRSVMATLQLPQPTWFVGCGNMGGAILDGWRTGGLDLSPVIVIRPSGTPVEGARVVRKYAEAGPPPALVVLAFKPQKLDEVATELRRFLGA